MDMDKNQLQLLKMITAIVNIDGFDLSLGDGKYILSNMIAKYSNSGKIFLSEKTKNILEEKDCDTTGEVKYLSKFYGKSSKNFKNLLSSYLSNNR